MEDIEDYDDDLIKLTKQIEKYFNYADSANGSGARAATNANDKTLFLDKIKENLEEIKRIIGYFKAEIYKIPKEYEAKYKQKLVDY